MAFSSDSILNSGCYFAHSEEGVCVCCGVILDIADINLYWGLCFNCLTKAPGHKKRLKETKLKLDKAINEYLLNHN